MSDIGSKMYKKGNAVKVLECVQLEPSTTK